MKTLHKIMLFFTIMTAIATTSCANGSNDEEIVNYYKEHYMTDNVEIVELGELDSLCVPRYVIFAQTEYARMGANLAERSAIIVEKYAKRGNFGKQYLAELGKLCDEVEKNKAESDQKYEKACELIQNPDLAFADRENFETLGRKVKVKIDGVAIDDVVYFMSSGKINSSFSSLKEALANSKAAKEKLEDELDITRNDRF